MDSPAAVPYGGRCATSGAEYAEMHTVRCLVVTTEEVLDEYETALTSSSARWAGRSDPGMVSAAGLLVALRAVLARELGAVERTIAAYPDDESLWRELPGAPNSGGSLVLHMAGNLRHFVGAGLGGTNYERDREAEFAAGGHSRAELEELVEVTAREVDAALASASPDLFSQEHALPAGGWLVRNDELLLHLASHLAYHLGQLDYHRRIATGQSVGVNAVAVDVLPSARRPEAE